LATLEDLAMRKRFYVTTAIDYVNGSPHLGHAYEKVITDVIARAHRAMGEPVFYLTGTDEHGQKVQQAAVAAGKSPQEYCDELAQIWQQFARTLNLSNDGFVRTTDPKHEAIVQAMLQKIYEKGDIYKARYEGYYSTKEETFLTERDRRPDGTFDPAYGEVIYLAEENYYFRISAYQDWILEHIRKNPEFVAPDYRRNEVLGFLENNKLEDLCITRPKSRLQWGIPVPFDEEFVTYVWFDALINYISYPAMLGDAGVIQPLADWLPDRTAFPIDPTVSLWPADIHVIGKDIIKFHAVYWPIMLHAAGLPLPRQILVHGWWQKDNQRMSKSLGNVVDPVAVIQEWGVDAFRYYVVRELDIGPDGNWTDAGFANRYHAELANGLGNLLNRSLSMLHRYREGVVPAPHEELRAEVEQHVQTVRELLLQHKLQAALKEIWAIIDRANQYVDSTQPFKLAKDPSQAERLDQILYNLVETCRILAVLLSPFLPQTADRIYEQLQLPDRPDRWEKTAWGGMAQGHRVAKPTPLFPRKDRPSKQS